jgi:hypothetical protein
MALKNELPLNPVVNIIVNLSTISAPRKAFDTACLMGDVGAVADFTNARIVTYDSVDSMLSAGFPSTSRIVKAAQLIFGQAKTPRQVMVGKAGTVNTAGKNTYTLTTNAVAEDTVTFGGVTLTAGAENGFAVGETVAATATNIAAAFAANATINATYNVTVDGAAIVVTEKTAGGGDTPGAMTTTGTLVIAAGMATSSATRAETPVETYTACRQADGEWYVGLICADLTDEQILEVAAYNESCTPDSVFAFTTAEAAVTDPTDGGIFSQLQLLMYRRTIGQYSTAHPDAIAAIVGWAMGAMTGTANSAYTLAYKSEVGVLAENAVQNFSTNKVNAVKSFNGNVYINRGSYYNIFEEGKVFDGSWFDEIIYLDKFKNDCQLTIMDLLVQNNKLPQTESGMGRIKNAIKTECESLNTIGFISAGVWKSGDMLDLKYGDTLPRGYIIQSEPINDQSQADRDARKAPPIYVSLKLAGAIHHVTVQVDVNR